MTIKEEWRDVVGYEGVYQVSDLGRVKSLARTSRNRYGVRPIRERILRQHPDRGGYLQVNLPCDSKPKSHRVHKLVAEAFTPNPKNKPCVDHVNSIRNDNRAENLVWATYSENNLRAIARLGSNSKRGEDHEFGVLMESQVLEICQLLNEGVLLQKQIASMYQVSSAAISDIYRGNSWNWLTGRKSRPGGHYGKSK